MRGPCARRRRFRSKGRLPCLSFLHKNGAAIARCSQPLRGLGKRSAEDEALVQAIHAANPSGKVTYIVDTRPKVCHACCCRCCYVSTRVF